MDIREIIARAKGLSISLSWAFGGPDASKDLCKTCGVMRKDHENKTHKFKED